MSPLRGVLATGAATYADLRRRHGILLAALAIAVLLLLLPDICARAVDESAPLCMQVGLSTIGVFLAFVAGFAGLRCGAAEGDFAATSEWRTPPLTPAAYVLGRFGGIAALVAVVFAALAPFLVAGQIDTLRLDPPGPHVAALAALGVLVSAALFAAIGMFLATTMSSQLAAILFLATMVATRTLVPSLAARGTLFGWIAAFLPDPARLDLSRELAFHRPVDTTAMTFACAAGALHVTAFLCAAAWSLRRRET
jgi:hypothetical protein